MLSPSAPHASYAFCGNRFFVLEAMREAGLDVVHIGAVADSYLDKTLRDKAIAFTACGNKAEFLGWLHNISFDIFVANGCPWKIPVTDFPHKRFVNVHPSFLPDLRGADPIPGALLYGRDSGATCHVMDNDFDTGDIIAQTRIPYTPELDALSLYPLSFTIEAEVFTEALARNFIPMTAQQPTGNEIYYTFNERDLLIDFSAPAEAIYRRVRAFNTPNKLARFTVNNTLIKITNAELLPLDAFHTRHENEIIDGHGNMLVIKKQDALLKLTCTDRPASIVAAGTVLI